MRKRYSKELKSRIVLEILQTDKTVNEIALEYGVHVNQLRRWDKVAIERLPFLFGKDSKDLNKMKTGYERKIENLYSEIGRLTTQLSELKTKDF